MPAPRRRLNCWEYRNCGREKGGLMVALLGECPVAAAMKYDGHNGGIAAGRSCWLVPESECQALGTSAAGNRNCHECEFYRRVMNEEAGKAQGAYHSVTA
jgi:hypothetical protein